MAHSKVQTAKEACDICMRAPGLNHCTQCDQFFCNDCKMSHLRTTFCEDHTFMTETNINREKKAGRCKDHNADFIYFCLDCDKFICRLCVTKAHLRHTVVDIKDSNKKVRCEISKYLDFKVDIVRSSATLIEGQTKTYTTEVEETVKVITEHGNLIKAMVDEKVDALIKALREKESIELQPLSKTNKDCKDLLEEATRQQQSYQDMIEQCDEVALFHKMRKFKSDIDNWKTVGVRRLPSVAYNRKRVNFSDVEKLFGNLTFQSTVVKQYVYFCRNCWTDRLSEKSPFSESFIASAVLFFRGFPPVDMDCTKCGGKQAHCFIGTP